MGLTTPTSKPPFANRVTRTVPGTGSANRLPEPWMTALRGWALLAMAEMTLFTVIGTAPRFNQVISDAARYASPLAEAGIPAWVYNAVHIGGAVPFLTLFPALALIILIRRLDDWTAMVQALALFALGMNSSLFAEALIKPVAASPLLVPPVDFIRAVAENFSIIPLVFIPTGRAEPRWMRYPAIAILLYGVIRPFLYGTALHTQSWPSGLQALWFLGTLGLGVFSMVYRYRKVSTQIQKQQQKWIILGIAIGVGGVIVLKAIPGFNPGLVLDPARPTAAAVTWSILDYLIYTITEIPIPIAVAFAILRYRLWDIDFYINRTLVYGGLTAALVGVFAVTLFGLNAALDAVPVLHDIPGIALAGSALMVGILFQPARVNIRRFVDHLYGIEIDYKGALKKEAALERAVAHDADARTSFGAYTDIALLGRGGMGEVYRATHPTLKNYVAIKLLPTTLIDNEEAVKRFIREAQTIARLRHPNIVGIQDFGEMNNTPYMVMDYIDGRTLSDVIKASGAMAFSDALPILRDVASAIDYAHVEGIVHRDIKPSNVMIEASPPVPLSTSGEGGTAGRGRAVLMDFGIARIVSGQATRLTQTGMIGTLDYIAPEQIQEASDVDGRADIYSLGVVAYQMLTGQLPFTRANPAAMLIAHLMEPPADPRFVKPDIPAGANYAILRALAKKPEERFNTATEMISAMVA